jgi:hypothetical protein
MPFGRGRAIAPHVNRVINGVIGGWTMNYIYTYNSGIPVSGINTLFLCSSYLTTDQTHDHWFNNTQSCYKGFPNSYYLRTMPDSLPWLRQMDNMTTNLSIAKTFQVTERWRFNLRGRGVQPDESSAVWRSGYHLHRRPLRHASAGPAELSSLGADFGQVVVLEYLPVIREESRAVPGKGLSSEERRLPGGAIRLREYRSRPSLLPDR